MKKGSALLIVLGMISFMLFSGIAFSVYMRQARLPSSFLRRTSVTRNLAKAAVAEAMFAVDKAIGDLPHPGVGVSTSAGNNNTTSGGLTVEDDDDDTKYGNYWNHRIFTGQSTDYTGSTTSTLTLEGLAYLPPCLINEARYYSRKTPTAAWQSFRFEAGRYAYTAIDVSDFFDVNRALADRPRSSAASRRITLAHIFEKNGEGRLHGAAAGSEAEEWDAWLEDEVNARAVDDDDKITFSGKMPLVSLADFNLAMADKTFGNIQSPFIAYLNANEGTFYSYAVDDEKIEGCRSMTFVTDSLFREAASDEYDLENGDNQPFEMSDLKNKGTKGLSLVELMEKPDSRPCGSEYLKLLSRIGMATLYDYLDENSLPVSLAIPTVEKNPMICAIDMDYENIPIVLKRVEGNLRNGTGTGDPSKTPPKRDVTMTVDYVLDGGELGLKIKGGKVRGLALYPFLHQESSPSVTLDGRLAFFLRRNDSAKLKMALDRGNDNFTFGKDGSKDPDSTVKLDETTGLLSMPLQGNISVPTEMKTVDDALIEFDAKVDKAKDIENLLSKKKPWISITYKWEQTLDKDSEGEYLDANDDANWKPAFDSASVQKWENVVKTGNQKFTCRWYPLDGDGKKIEDDEKMYNSIADGTIYRLHAAVWLRLKNSEGTVDMVPACIYDDKEQGLFSDDPAAIQMDRNLKRYFCNIEGRGRHVMRFDFNDADGNGFSLKDVTSEDKTFSLAPSPKKVMVADPRYNHNPENWFAPQNAGDDLKTMWKDNNCYTARDGDFFMSVSDQGYLQSIHELGFLPRFTIPGNENDDPVGSQLSDSDKFVEGRTEFATGFGDSRRANVMWNTYDIFKADADAFVDSGFVSGIKGLKVNPYSDSPEVLAAAFANTPLDWSHASTNVDMNAACDDGVETFNTKYAWNAYCDDTGHRIAWDFIQDIAEDYMSDVRNRNGDWEAAFNHRWDATSGVSGQGIKSLCGRLTDGYDGMNQTEFHSVDKKFLYGFWKDSFAANQQLFLVFVRAEPMMMGGGVAGNAPPQLSSRAVALVWRDPLAREESGSGNSGQSGDNTSYIPHKMRILFYHPLD